MSPIKIALLSDLHFFSLKFDSYFQVFSKAFLATCNHLIRRNWKEENLSHIEDVPKLLEELSVDQIWICGDFTTKSTIKEFQLAKNYINQFKAPSLQIPGNHDTYTKSSERKKLFYKFFSMNDTLEKNKITVKKLANNWWWIALDTTFATPLYSSEGNFPEDLEQKLRHELDSIPKSEPVILFNHFPVNDAERPKRHRMRRSSALRRLLKSYPQIKLYIYGHTHIPEVLDLREESLPVLINSGSLTQTNPPTFALLEICDKKISTTFYQWDSQWQKDRCLSFKF